MNRRSFLSALGLAPLAAWLSSRAEAKALPPITVIHEGTINPEGAAEWASETIDADAALSGRYAYVAEPPLPDFDPLTERDAAGNGRVKYAEKLPPTTPEREHVAKRRARARRKP